MPAAWLPPGKQTFVDANGEPLSGGKVHHYVPGLGARKDTWVDLDQTALNTNPVILDASGQCTIFGHGTYRQVVYDSADNLIWDQVVAVGGATTLAAGAIFGLSISNNAGNPTTQIDVAVGQCRDSTDTVDIEITAPITKDLTAVWAAGTGLGGRDSAAALVADTTWHVHLIYDDETGTADVLFSQSATAPTLPAGYTYFRRVGSVLLEDATTAIRLFEQHGDWFMLTTRTADFASAVNGGAAFLRTVSVPAGIRVKAQFLLQSTGSAVTGQAYWTGVYDPAFGLPAAFGTPTQFGQIRRLVYQNGAGANESYGFAIVEQWTNTSQQVYTTSSDAGDLMALGVVGWMDTRSLG